MKFSFAVLLIHGAEFNYKQICGSEILIELIIMIDIM